jgi:hypothetical protein
MKLGGIGRAAITAAVALALWSVGFSKPASAQLRYFRVCPGPTMDGCGTPYDFTIALGQQKQIQIAEQILSGKITDMVHVEGMIVTKPAFYNWPLMFHLDPNSIGFFTFAHPTCWGYSTVDVNANLDKIGSPGFLPTHYWCPRGYRISKEIHGYW